MYPAALAADNFAGDKKASARNGAACAKAHSGVIEVFGFPQEPQAISGGNPVGAKVFGIAVAGDNPIAAVKHLVHLLYIVLIQQVIRVEDEISIEIGFAIFRRDFMKRIIQGIALAYFLLVKAPIDDCPVLFCNFRSVICAVIRNDKDLQKLFWIFLHFEGIYKLANDRALVARRYDNAESVLLAAKRRLAFFLIPIISDKRDNDIKHLICIHRRDKDKDR